MYFNNYDRYNKTVTFIIDTIYCTIYGIKRRMVHNDLKLIGLWSIILTVAIIFYVFTYVLLTLFYIASMCLLYYEYLRFRSKEKQINVGNLVEVLKYDIIDVTIIIGHWKGKRNYMEDEFFICPRNKLFGVIDGHGGGDISKYLSNNYGAEYDRMYHNLMINCTNDANNCLNMDDLTIDTLEKTFIKMDHDMYNKKLNGGAVGMVVKINDNKIYCTNVGDSSAILLTENNQIIPLTRLHSMSNYYEYCRYRSVMDPICPKKRYVMRTVSGLMPSRTIGDYKCRKKDPGLVIDPETITVKLKQFDSMDREIITDDVNNWKMIALGTDGIWDCISSTELCEMINEQILQSDQNMGSDVMYNKLVDMMTKLQGITNKCPDTVDKLTSRYYGDNCTLMIVINNKIEK